MSTRQTFRLRIDFKTKCRGFDCSLLRREFHGQLFLYNNMLFELFNDKRYKHSAKNKVYRDAMFKNEEKDH